MSAWIFVQDSDKYLIVSSSTPCVECCVSTGVEMADPSDRLNTSNHLLFHFIIIYLRFNFHLEGIAFLGSVHILYVPGKIPSFSVLVTCVCMWTRLILSWKLLSHKTWCLLKRSLFIIHNRYFVGTHFEGSLCIVISQVW